jgi:hypothetical protein
MFLLLSLSSYRPLSLLQVEKEQRKLRWSFSERQGNVSICCAGKPLEPESFQPFEVSVAIVSVFYKSLPPSRSVIN